MARSTASSPTIGRTVTSSGRRPGRKSGSKVVVVDGRRRVLELSEVSPSMPSHAQQQPSDASRPASSSALHLANDSSIACELESESEDDGDVGIISYKPSPEVDAMVAADDDDDDDDYDMLVMDAAVVVAGSSRSTPAESRSPNPPASSSSSIQMRSRAAPVPAVAAAGGASSTKAGRPSRANALPSLPPVASARKTPELESQRDLFKDDASDIMVVSSDGRSFPFRQSYLVTASALFETELPGGNAKKRRTTSSQLRVVVLEPAADLETFLLFTHPRVDSPKLADLDELQRLCAMAERLEARSILLLLLAQAPHFLAGHAPAILALALIHHPPDLAHLALREFEVGFRKEPVARQPGVFRCGRPRWTVADIPDGLFRRLPGHTKRVLDRYQMRLLDVFDQDVQSWAPVYDLLRDDASALASADVCDALLE